MKMKCHHRFPFWVITGMLLLMVEMAVWGQVPKTDSVENISSLPDDPVPVQFSMQDSFSINYPNLEANSFNQKCPKPYDTSRMYRNRQLWMTGLHVGAYGGSLLVLSQAWYKDYPQGQFKTINDWPEWLQVDKIGHGWSAYQLSRVSYAGWRWAGVPEKKAILAGGLSGFAFLTAVEILDGFSEQWGWSWSDFGANAIGCGMFMGQQLGWKEQRISFKFGFHKMVYADPELNTISDDIFGSSLPERMLKDYNGQTYWLSANLQSFFKQSKLPPWLNMAVGYGGNNMFGAKNNTWVDPETGAFIDKTNIPRVRQWYLAPDIDFTKIKTNHKWMRSLLYCLNIFKLPAPTLVLSSGKVVVHGFYF